MTKEEAERMIGLINSTIETISTKLIPYIEACIQVSEERTRRKWDELGSYSDMGELRLMTKLTEFLRGAKGCLEGAEGLLGGCLSLLYYWIPSGEVNKNEEGGNATK